MYQLTNLLWNAIVNFIHSILGSCNSSTLSTMDSMFNNYYPQFSKISLFVPLDIWLFGITFILLTQFGLFGWRIIRIIIRAFTLGKIQL